ncbi:MAG: hypothetical protein VB108_11640 [Anaerolineaceae bacterium]|nr:hypothetical protein [Anaerolineaceae bacterium]
MEDKCIKVCILGGSALATPLLIRSMKMLKVRANYQIVFQGRNLQKLEAVQRLSQGFIQNLGIKDIGVSISTDSAQALDGADYVINQIRVGGLKARQFDESFPVEIGIPGEESIGPGSFSNALRSLSTIMDYCHACEQYAPDAVWINLSNPSSMLQYAIQEYTQIKCIGVCDMPENLLNQVALFLDSSVKKLEFEWGGMNHLGWLCKVSINGEPQLPRILEGLEKNNFLNVAPDLTRAVGAIPADYLKYYFHPKEQLLKKIGKDRSKELMDINDMMLQVMQNWKPGDDFAVLETRNAKWYDSIVAPLLVSLAEKRDVELILSVRNNGEYDFLPENAVIEVPIALSGGKLGKPRGAKLPVLARSLVSRVCAYEQAAIDSMMEMDRQKALQALMLNPMIHDFKQAQYTLLKTWPKK